MLASTFTDVTESVSIHCVYEVKNTFTVNKKYSVGCRASFKKKQGRDFTIVSFDKTEVDAWNVNNTDTSPWFKEKKGKISENQLAEYVVFQSQAHVNIPEGIATVFPNMRTFVFNNAGVKMISKYDLRQFDKIERFDFDNNVLEYLESENFGFNPKLQHLSVQSNKIKILSETVGLNNTTNFVHFNMVGNECFREEKTCANIEECKTFVNKAMKACKAPAGFDLGVIREDQWEQDRRVIELTELENDVRVLGSVLKGIAGVLKQ